MEDARIGLVVDGRYRIEKRLAAGGMGVVYRAQRIGLTKQVAIKFLHRSQVAVANRRQRFDREAAAMSRLSHPNLVSIIDYGEIEDAPYLVMEYQKGEPLKALIDRGPVPGPRAVVIVRQMLAGLDSAHVSGVVHRDLKPDNILLAGKPGADLVKILDFGVAKLIEGDGGPSEMSVMAGSLLGTAEYMAPEQVRCEVVDARADVYACGIILYELVTGRRPFIAERDLAVLRMQLEDTPRPPREQAPAISAQLEVVILRALEKDRDRRWASAEEMSTALLATPEGRGTGRMSVRQPELPAPDAAPPRRRRWPYVVVPLLLLLASFATLMVVHDLGWIDAPPLDDLRAWLAGTFG